MAETETMFRNLSKISPFLEKVVKRADANLFYAIFSSAPIWTDEPPKSVSVRRDCLRFVFRYRTGLLIGEPEPTRSHFWQEAWR